MKKLFFVFTFVFSLFFISNVKAISNRTVTGYYDDEYIKVDFLDDDVINIINNEMIPYLDNTIGSDYMYVIAVDPDLTHIIDDPEHLYQNLLRLYIFPKRYDNQFHDGVFGLTIYTSNDSIEFYSRFWNDGYPTDFHGASNWTAYRLFEGFDLTQSSITSYKTLIENWLQNPTWTNKDLFYNGLAYAYSLTQRPTFTNNNYDYLVSGMDKLTERLIYYSNVDLVLSSGGSDYDNFSNFILKYEGHTYEYTLGDSFPTYYNVKSGDYQIPVQLVANYGNNTYGFYNNYMSVHDIGVGNDVFNVAVVCETDKPFANGYCVLDYNDLINYNSNINFFKKSALGFTHLFGHNSGYIDDDKYFIYGFRVLKPFVPSVAGVRIDTTDGVYEVPNSNILKVNKYDGGSYTDYAVTFKIDNSNITNSTEIKSMFILFTGPLESYYPSIPSSFNLSVYRSFKLQMFDDIPTSSDIESFIFENDLSSIDGTNNQNSFFTDTKFNTYGFGGIVTAPFRILYALEDYQSCQSIYLPFPYSDGQLQLQCVRESIPSSVSPLISLLQVFLTGFVCYRIAVGTLKLIKDTLNPKNDDIEVVDL